MMVAKHLQIEYLNEPLGIGTAKPRFYWNCEGGITQTAYQLICRLGDEIIWDSGKVCSSTMSHIAYEGTKLHSRDKVDWSLQLWNENHIAGEISESSFEIGLLQESDWSAKWIAAPVKEKKNERCPVDCFKKEFVSIKEIKSARLYASACGLYEISLNGEKVGDGVLLPGNTDIRKRIQYQTFDITKLLKENNVITAELADGWYRGTVGAFGPRNVYGRQTKLLIQIEIIYCDGDSETVISDDSWAWSNDGSIQFADLEDGEIIDARRMPSYRGKAILADDRGLPVPTASDNVLPKKQERFKGTLLTTPSGKKVIDFGQNLAGMLAFKVHATAGQKIDIRLGEVLDGNGEFIQCNMQEIRPVKEFNKFTNTLFIAGMGKLYRGETQPTPLQEIHYVCADGPNYYEGKFMISGFRYALVETDVDFFAEDFESIAVYSDMEQTGEFECSNDLINQIVKNNRWSMKSNHCDVPTDCPTRERLAWTGDAQIYFNTGSYFMNMAPFMRKWMRDVQDGIMKDGKLPSVVPYNGSAMCYEATGSSAGWQDAAILVPYRYYKRYGDVIQLEENYETMKKAALFMINHSGPIDKKATKENPYSKYIYEKGMHLGEWLEPKEFQEQITAKTRTTHPEECTAYLHYSMTCMEKVAKILNKENDSKLFAEYAEGSKNAYQWMFLQHGAPDTDRQAKLVRPLAFDIADGEIKEAIAKRLVKAVENRDYKIATGFLSTVFLLPTLTKIGRSDLAYKVLENEECPGWIYQIKHGATTNWESWEGYTGSAGSGSYNHYSPGAVCEWIFSSVGGINVEGERHFVISPVPGGSLTFAKTSYKSLYGEVTCQWNIEDKNTIYKVSIPSNTTADIELPNGEKKTLMAGEYVFSS